MGYGLLFQKINTIYNGVKTGVIRDDRRNFLKFTIALTATLTGIDVVVTPIIEAAGRRDPNWGGMLDDYARKEFKADRFKVENKVILDKLTGLMWARNNIPLGTIWVAHSYSDAKETVKRLNGDKHAGYNSWRIPGEYDWITVIDKRRRKPILVKGFDIGDIGYKFPYWIRKEDRENKECAQLDGAVSCLPPKNGILLENGVYPSIIPYGILLPVRTHDQKHYEKFLNFFFDLLSSKKARKKAGRPSVNQ